MNKGRLEAFTDGVIAIIITIMVLELTVPQGADWADLHPVLPMLAAYLLSFVNVGIFWNNHHHMLHAVQRVSGAALWANLALLFAISLVPFVIRWVDQVGLTAALPTAAYGVVLFGAALGYMLLERALMSANGCEHSQLASAVGSDYKTIFSLIAYACAIPLAFVSVWLSDALYVAVALAWFVPDQRIESAVQDDRSLKFARKDARRKNP
ncbi:MAG: TMEM175 family protein [Rhodanobacteraceae bacterium]